ncbi:MAG: hypothetical protein ACP5O3_03450 [Candidatus Micrarchaeia archaeon]
MKSRKGQSALEYLVTYGWAILVIVIIAAVLWYFGVFNPNKWTVDKQCGGFSGLQCIDYTASESAGTASIVLGNGVGRSINITSYGVGQNTTTIAAGLKLLPNAKTTLSASSIGSSTGGEYVVWVYYTDLTSGLAHNDTGFVKAQ